MIIAGAGVGFQAFNASAAFDGEVYETQFEIDGNTAVDGTQDWDSAPVDAPNLQDSPFRTDEVCGDNPTEIEDPDNPGQIITVTNEPFDSVVVQGTKIDDILIDEVPVGGVNVPIKADLCSVWRSWELVFVPVDPNDPSAGGQYQFILYGAWSRPDVNGEINVLFPLLGADTTTNDDDLIVSYDFDDNTGDTTVEVLDWSGTEWSDADLQLPAGAFEAETTHGEVTHPVTNAALTFGEFALNLTVSGILPEDGPCTTFSTGDPLSRTGNSPSATLKDIVNVTPLTLTNCGSLTINKHTQPEVVDGEQTFTTLTNEVDGRIIQHPDTTELEDSLVVPTSPSVTHTGMLISPDYVVAETDLPDGWSQESLVCTSYDPLTGEDVTRVLWDHGDNGPDASFPIAPGVEAVCDVLNIGPPTITLNKVTVGKAGGPFTINATRDGGLVQAILQTVEAGVPVGATFEVAPGEYTVGENHIDLPGWFAGDLACSLNGKEAVVVNPTEGEPSTQTFDVDRGDALECTQTNLAAGSVTVTKTVEGTSTDWSFDFTISPVPVGESPDPKTADAQNPVVRWDNLEPGVSYTVAEVDNADDGFDHGTVGCDDGEGNGDGTFTAWAGVEVACTVTNTERGSAEVTKLVEGTTGDWAFDFTIAPAAPGQPATKTATEADPTVGWDNLDPDTEYTITEDPVDGYKPGDVSCGEGGASFVTGPGGAVSCSVTNVELGHVDVTKTVAGTASNWSFDFTISPVPAGETAKKTATKAAPTVSWDGLDPDVDYTITEANKAGFVKGAISCDEGDATFSPAPGGTVDCVVTNIQLASVNVTKTVAGEATTWAFDFTIAPVPAGESAKKTATNGAPTVGWAGLVPGTAYTITETDATGFTTGTLTCTGGTNGVGKSTFTPTPGQAVTCSITNDVVKQQAPPIADISVVKTATPTVVTPGGNVTWTLLASNAGPDPADNASIVDNLPAALTLVSFTAPAGWDCSASVTGNPGKLSCTKPSMGVNETATFTLSTTVAASAAGQTIDNTAVVSTTTNETNTSNNQDSEPITVQQAVLPPTGGYVWNRLAIAGLLVLVGIGFLAVDRRRRTLS